MKKISGKLDKMITRFPMPNIEATAMASSVDFPSIAPNITAKYTTTKVEPKMSLSRLRRTRQALVSSTSSFTS